MDEFGKTVRRSREGGTLPVFEVGLISLDAQSSRRRSSELSPLAALFPRIGTTEILPGTTEKLAGRVAELAASEELGGEKSFEDGMLRQVLQWLHQGEEPDLPRTAPKPFIPEELIGIYELGRLYYESGFLTPAERILHGLVLIDDGSTPSRGALGVVQLESGKSEEAVHHFRAAVKNPRRVEEILVGKLGLIACFLSVGDIERAATLVRESEADLSLLATEARNSNLLGQRAAELGELWQAFALRCGLKKGL